MEFEEQLTINIGLSPSGKAQHFDCCIRRVRIPLAQLGYKSRPDSAFKHDLLYALMALYDTSYI